MFKRVDKLAPEEAIGSSRGGGESRKSLVTGENDNKSSTQFDTDSISVIMSERAHQRLFNHSDDHSSNSYSCSILSAPANGCNATSSIISGIEKEDSINVSACRRNAIKTAATTMIKQKRRRTSRLTSVSPIKNDNCSFNNNNSTRKHQMISKSSKLVASLMSGGGGGCGALLSLVSLVTLLLLASPVARQTDGAKLPDIYWNSSNPIFRIDNTDHIFDVNKKLHDHDQVDLVCPSQQTANQMLSGTDQDQAGNKSALGETQQQQQSERYIIYSVSKDEYETCRLNAGQPAQAVAICDQQAGKPSRPPITITFRSFTPQPNGLEFKPGQDYYFITALHGHHTDQAKRFAPCRELNMKVIFKICCKSTSPAAPLVSNGQQQQQQSQLQQMRKSQILISQQPANQVKVQLNGLQQQPILSRPSNVMTVRPTYKPANGQQQPQQPLSDYFSTLTPGLSETINNMNQQQQQPVTVLPIEVIQPSSESSSSQSQSQGQQQQQDNQQLGDIKNDIQNEQPHLATIPAIRPNNAPPPAPFVPFDPHAPPTELLHGNRGRWTPTPLPPGLTQQLRDNNNNNAKTNGNANTPSAAHHQLNPAFWQLQPINQQQQQQQQQFQTPSRQHPQRAQTISEQQQQEVALNGAGRNAGPSRLGFYPWLNNGNTAGTAAADQQHQLSVSTRDLITVAQDQQQQQAGATGAPTFAVALLVPLLALAILLALGLERRLR